MYNKYNHKQFVVRMEAAQCFMDECFYENHIELSEAAPEFLDVCTDSSLEIINHSFLKIIRPITR